MTELEAFHAHFRMCGNSERTLEVYESTYKRLSARLDLGSATPFDLRSYLAERSTEVQAATLAVDIRAIRAFYRWRSEALDVEDPSRTLKLPMIPEPVTESCSRESYLKLLSAIPANSFWNCRDRALITVMWGSGARLSEVARMRGEDLDRDALVSVVAAAARGDIDSHHQIRLGQIELLDHAVNGTAPG